MTMCPIRIHGHAMSTSTQLLTTVKTIGPLVHQVSFFSISSAPTVLLPPLASTTTVGTPSPSVDSCDPHSSIDNYGGCRWPRQPSPAPNVDKSDDHAITPGPSGYFRSGRHQPSTTSPPPLLCCRPPPLSPAPAFTTVATSDVARSPHFFAAADRSANAEDAPPSPESEDIFSVGNTHPQRMLDGSSKRCIHWQVYTKQKIISATCIWGHLEVINAPRSNR